VEIAVNGARLWFDVEGAALVPVGDAMVQRPTVVLLHGGPGSFDHSYLKPDFTRLATVAQVIYLDLRDHGRSSRHDPAQWSYEQCADDVRAFVDALGIARPIVFGHSLGAFVALHVAIRHPHRLGALVVQSGLGKFDLARVAAGFRRFGDAAAAAAAERFYSGDMSATDEFRARCRPLFGRWVPGDDERARMVLNLELLDRGIECMRQLDVLDQARAVTCPTLVCTGERDPITQVADAEDLVAALTSCRAQLLILPGMGHFPWKDDPEGYWPPITSFISRALRTVP